MKKLSLQVLILFLLTAFLSCHHNRLKTNEKELAKEIIKQEKEKKKADSALLLKESIGRPKLSGSFRMKEIRSVDQSRPPVRIDILDTLNITRRLKLSDIASSIRYLKLENPPDTMMLYDPSFYYHTDLNSIIRSDGEQIIFQGLFGLTRFSMQGEYLETIWKNKTGIKFYGSGVMYGGKDFFGVLPNFPISISNGNLYYLFQNGPEGNSQVMKYKTGINNNLSIKSQAEIPEPGTIQGDTLLNANKIFPESFDYIFGVGTGTWAGINQKWNAGRSGVMLVTYNDKGDTLCKFTDYDQIKNFANRAYRKPVDLSCYYFHGLLTIRQEYNDTVFRLIPPDRLMPVFIITFKGSKINYMDVLNPDFNLSGKYLISSIQETNDYLFIKYIKFFTQGTNNKNGIKVYYTIYNKKESKLYNQTTFSFEPSGLINDLDGGMTFWPDFVTPQGEMMKLVSGKVLKGYFSSSEFKQTSVSEEKRQKLISMASGLKPTDMIVVIVK